MNITIPENMVNQLQEFLTTLNVQPSSSTSVQAQQVEEVQYYREICEVVKINAHRINERGQFTFQVVWKNRSTQWVDDDECDCESLIGEYLKGKNIRTAYLFCRVSTPDQAKSTNLSLDAQKDELMSAVKDFGTTFGRIRVYQISSSAYTKIPDKLQEIGEAAGNGDAILVWRVDRLSRNIEQSLEWLRDLDSRKVAIYSHQEKLQFAKNKLGFYQALLDSQKEANLLGERIRLAFRRKKERGDEHIGRLKFGKKYKRILDNNGTTRKMIVVNDPVEQSIIKRIFKSKKTPNMLASSLNREGISKRGRKWSGGMIRTLLRSSVNID